MLTKKLSSDNGMYVYRAEENHFQRETVCKIPEQMHSDVLFSLLTALQTLRSVSNLSAKT
jgi:hypothetical protein